MNAVTIVNFFGEIFSNILYVVYSPDGSGISRFIGNITDSGTNSEKKAKRCAP